MCAQKSIIFQPAKEVSKLKAIFSLNVSKQNSIIIWMSTNKYLENLIDFCALTFRERNKPPRSYPFVLDFWFEICTSRNWFFILIFCLFHTWILQATQAVEIQFKLGKKSSSSNSKFQTRECQKSSADR